MAGKTNPATASPPIVGNVSPAGHCSGEAALLTAKQRTLCEFFGAVEGDEVFLEANR